MRWPARIRGSSAAISDGRRLVGIPPLLHIRGQTCLFRLSQPSVRRSAVATSLTSNGLAMENEAHRRSILMSRWGPDGLNQRLCSGKGDFMGIHQRRVEDRSAQVAELAARSSSCSCGAAISVLTTRGDVRHCWKTSFPGRSRLRSADPRREGQRPIENAVVNEGFEVG